MSVTEPETQQLSPTGDVSTAVVVAVADVTDTHPTDLPPLYDVVDPDALDAIFRPSGDGQPGPGVHVTFTMAGCTVSIRDGAITVTADSEAATERPPSRSAQED